MEGNSYDVFVTRVVTETLIVRVNVDSHQDNFDAEKKVKSLQENNSLNWDTAEVESEMRFSGASAPKQLPEGTDLAYIDLYGDD